MKTPQKINDDLGICVKCNKRKATLKYCNSILEYTHGFTQNLCSECYKDLQENHPLFQKGKQKVLQELECFINDKKNWAETPLISLGTLREFIEQIKNQGGKENGKKS